MPQFQHLKENSGSGLGLQHLLSLYPLSCLHRLFINPQIVKQILLLFLLPHWLLVLSLRFCSLPLTLEGPRTESLDVFFIIVHILGELIQSIYSSDSRIYYLQLRLLCWIPDFYTPLSIWYLHLDAYRHLKLLCPIWKPQFLPTSTPQTSWPYKASCSQLMTTPSFQLLNTSLSVTLVPHSPHSICQKILLAVRKPSRNSISRHQSASSAL